MFFEQLKDRVTPATHFLYSVFLLTLHFLNVVSNYSEDEKVFLEIQIK